MSPLIHPEQSVLKIIISFNFEITFDSILVPKISL